MFDPRTTPVAVPSPQLPSRRSLRRHLLKLVAGTLVALAASTAAGAIALRTAIDRGVRQQAAALESRLGRSVTVGAVVVELLPRLRLEVRDVRIAAARGSHGVAARPLLAIDAVRAVVPWQPIARSRGTRIEVDSIAIEAPRLALVRLPAGGLSIDDVIARLARPARPTGAPQAASPTVRIATIALVRGEIRGAYEPVPGAHPAPEMTLARLEIRGRDIDASQRFAIDIDASLDEPNQHVHCRVGFTPGSDRASPRTPLPRVQQVSLRTDAARVAAAIEFVRGRPLHAVQDATLRADLTVDMETARPAFRARGEIEARGISLGEFVTSAMRDPTRRVDVRLAADLEAEPAVGNIVVRTLDLRVDDMALHASADLRNLRTLPMVSALALESSGITLEALAAWIPPDRIPPGGVLSGPVSIRAAASGRPDNARLDATASLDGATIVLPMLHKDAHTRLAVEFHGDLRPGRLGVERAGIALGPLALWVHGSVHSAHAYDLDFDSDQTPIDGVLRLLPEVRHSIPAGVTLAGNLRASGSLHESGEHHRGSARVVLSRANAVVQTLTLAGDARLAATWDASPHHLEVDGEFDASAARVRVPGRIDKPAGSAFRAHVRFGRTGDQVTVERASLVLPGATVEARGSGSLAQHRLDVRASQCSIDLVQLSRVLPLLGEKLPPLLRGARMQFALALEGDPAALARTARVHVTDIDLRAAFGRVHGRFDSVGVSPLQQLFFDLDAPTLDLSEFSRGADSAGAGHGGDDGDTRALLAQLAVHGILRVASLRAGATPLGRLDMRVQLSHGRLTLPAAQLDGYGGHVTAAGSSVDLVAAGSPFALRVRAQHLDVAQLAALSGRPPERRPDGSLDLDVDLTGRADPAPRVRASLSGTLSATLTNAHLRRMTTPTVTIVDPILSHFAQSVPQSQLTQSRSDQPINVRSLVATFDVHDGALRTTLPVEIDTDLGGLTVAGRIERDDSLALDGEVRLAPQAVQQASGGRLIPRDPVPVIIRLSGSASAPHVDIVDVALTPFIAAGFRGLRDRFERMRLGRGR